ncbi:hypothetical protein CASFOL_028451 [Castilleja foliolosa]|uniref:Uncharacterized protein n=1 Tax=Castilleja foliolosa TaxID=1961234 RepID=A0ABD3CB56_9LAMI
MPRARGAYAGIIYCGQRSQSGGRGSLDSSSTESSVDDMLDLDEDLAIPPTPSDHGSPAPTAPMPSSLSSPNRIEVYILVDRVASDNKELATILREIHETKLHDNGWAYREIPDDHCKTWWHAFLRRLNWAQVHICEAYAQLSCTGTGKCWLSEGELLNNLNEYKTRDSDGMDEAVYMSAKQKALETIRSVLETRTDNHGVEEFKCPELLLYHYKPLSCIVRQWILQKLCYGTYMLKLVDYIKVYSFWDAY